MRVFNRRRSAIGRFAFSLSFNVPRSCVITYRGFLTPTASLTLSDHTDGNIGRWSHTAESRGAGRWHKKKLRFAYSSSRIPFSRVNHLPVRDRSTCANLAISSLGFVRLRALGRGRDDKPHVYQLAASIFLVSFWVALNARYDVVFRKKAAKK